MVAGSYRSVQARIADLVSTADPSVVVPAAPRWTIRDLVAHLTGLAADVVEGKLDGYGGDPWTERQVADRAAMSIDDLLIEWDELTGELDSILEHPTSAGLGATFETEALGPQPVETLPGAVLGDAVIHEQDLRGALGDRNARTSAELVGALDAMIRGLRRGFPRAGLPTLRVVATDVGMEWLMGLDAPAAELRGSAFELFRTVSGRRTRGEIAALGWTGDPTPFVDHLVWPFFTPPAESLGES
ncbi:MAG: maleylpyruvate isomerase family mycothiol-dependent enzyme [Acidimicrobiia bacterium]